MGFLISVEGGDYTGKTSLVVPSLEKMFKKSGFTVVTSREPGGTPEGEKIRQLIFEKIKQGTSAIEMAILFNKARQLHIKQFIIPYLGPNKERHKILILDRYLDSTRVYQGLEGGVSMEKIYALEREYVNGFFPDLTLILFFPEKKFAATLEARKNTEKNQLKNRPITTVWDSATLEVHKKRQDYYLSLPDLAKTHGENRRFALIDASRLPNQVTDDCFQACLKATGPI